MKEQNWKEIIKNIIQINYRDEFDLKNDLYSYSEYLKDLYPLNNTIEASIRRNLQELEKEGYISFLGEGKYSIVKGTSSFKNLLNSFIKQSHTNNLKTASYPKNFRNLEVKVSFGQGNQALIPWIAFLGLNNKVQKGIYPVFLYYKDIGTLILSFGVSETENPDYLWSEIIQKENKLIQSKFKVKRYGDSLIFKTYKVIYDSNDIKYRDLESNWDVTSNLEKDIDEIINIYKRELKIQFDLPKAEKEIFEELSDNDLILTEDETPKKYKSCVAARSNKFSTAVKEVYLYTCAVCEKSRFTADGKVPEVEAAHIYPRKLNGRNNIKNGISLCTLHHWAFDGGLFVIDDNFLIKVNPKILNDKNYEEISKFQNKKIALPKDQKFYPASIYLKEHRVLHKFN